MNKDEKLWRINIKLILDQAFKETAVYQALPSFHGGSLEILLTVPLRIRINCSEIKKLSIVIVIIKYEKVFAGIFFSSYLLAGR